MLFHCTWYKHRRRLWLLKYILVPCLVAKENSLAKEDSLVREDILVKEDRLVKLGFRTPTAGVANQVVVELGPLDQVVDKSP